MRSRLSLPALALLAACGGPSGPSNDVSTGEAIVQLGDAVNDLRQQNADMQTQLDSLRAAVARQDTLITRLLAQPR